MSRRRAPQTAYPQYPSSRGLTTSSLILLGIFLGIGVGLYYAWVINPVVFQDASPARFSDSYKAEYIYLISQSYAADQDLERAKQRLATLEDPHIEQTIVSLLEQFLQEQRPPATLRTLAVLAQDLGITDNVVALFAPPGTVTPTATPTLTPTIPANPTPTIAPSVTPLPPTATLPPTPSPLPSPTTQLIYRLLSQEQLCLPDQPVSHIEVRTRDALLNPLAGVQVLVRWSDGSDHFFTGFKPGQGLDYGDFTMTVDVAYTVVLAEGSPEVSGLRIEPCPDTGLPGGWQLTFQNLVQRN